MNPEESELADFLFERSFDDYVLGNNLYWYLKVESCTSSDYNIILNNFKTFHENNPGSKLIQYVDAQEALAKEFEEIAISVANAPSKKKLPILKRLVEEKGLYNFDIEVQFLRKY